MIYRNVTRGKKISPHRLKRGDPKDTRDLGPRPKDTIFMKVQVISHEPIFMQLGPYVSDRSDPAVLQRKPAGSQKNTHSNTMSYLLKTAPVTRLASLSLAPSCYKRAREEALTWIRALN